MKKENEVKVGNHKICLLEKHRFNSFYGIENVADDSITILRLSNRKYRKIMKAIASETENESEVSITNFKHIHVAHEDKNGVKFESARGAICVMHYKTSNTIKVAIYAGKKTCQRIESVGYV